MKLSSKREEEILSLCNDLAEQMPMGHYSRKDLCAAITYWQDAAYQAGCKRAMTESEVVCLAAQALLEYTRKYRGRALPVIWSKLLDGLRELIKPMMKCGMENCKNTVDVRLVNFRVARAVNKFYAEATPMCWECRRRYKGEWRFHKKSVTSYSK